MHRLFMQDTSSANGALSPLAKKIGETSTQQPMRACQKLHLLVMYKCRLTNTFYVAYGGEGADMAEPHMPLQPVVCSTNCG